jgi:ketosteroid isomerase-like protein
VLEERGHAVVAPELPFEDPDTSYEERVRPALEALEGAAAPVVVVAHSLSAAYGPLVPADLIVYLCPAPTELFNVPAPMGRTRPGFPWPPDDGRGVSVWEPEAAIAAMYPRLPAEAARQAAGRLKPSGPPAGDYPLTQHPDVPAALVYTTADEFFEPEWERWAAGEVLGVGPIQIGGGHFPMLEAPEALAELLIRIRPGMSAIEGVVLGIIHAWNRSDVDAWLALGEPEIELRTAGVFPDFEPVYRGREGMARLWRSLREPWDSLAVELEDVRVQGERALVTYTYFAEGGGSGASAEVRFFMVVDFRDGLITRMTVKSTLEEALEVLRSA